MAGVPKITLNEGAKQTIRKLTNLRENLAISALTGNYKEFRKNSIEYADIAVDNYNLMSFVPKFATKKVSLFSRMGLNMLKVWFLNLFRIKTPNEKLFRKMGEKAKLEQDVRQSIYRY